MSDLFLLPLTETFLREEWIYRFALLLIVSVGVSIAYKSSHFNFGMSGQIALGAFLTLLFASWTGYQKSPFLAFWVGLLAFLLLLSLGVLLGFLTYRLKLNEFLSTWMLSQGIVPLLEGWMLSSSLRSADSARLASTKLPWHFSPSFVLIVALLLWIIWVILFYRTKYGLALRIWAGDKPFVLSLGFRPLLFMLLPLGFSVGLMGLAGFFLVTSLNNSYTVGLTGGWDILAITASLMVFHSPLGIFASSLFLSYLLTVQDLLTLSWGREIQWALWIQILLLLIFAFWQAWRARRSHA